MPGTNAGTGQPVAFRCWAERRAWWLPGTAHEVTRTGRTRPHRAAKVTPRVMGTAHEYACTCGHTGWSALADVLRRPSRRVT